MSGLSWPSMPPVLRDGEIALRPWQEADAEAVFLACQDPEIQRYTRVPVPYLREHAESFVGPAQQDKLTERSGVGFAVTDIATGELLGACGLVAVDGKQRRGGAGYWAAPWARDRGATTRALRLLTRWAFADLGLLEVYVEIDDTNAASLRVAQHVGFHPGDVEPHHEAHRGSPRLFVTLVLGPAEL